MNQQAYGLLQATGYREKTPTAFSLFEMLISLALVSLILILLMTAGMQTVTMWRELEEKEELMTEGTLLMQMICRDLRSASCVSEKMTFDISLPSSQKNIFFLIRTPSDDLVTVGYFVDSNKKGHCYRFFAKADETLAATAKGNLAELESHAAPGNPYCRLFAKHLLSWEITPVWNREKKIILLEINMTFGKTKSRYFLSTVVALPPS